MSDSHNKHTKRDGFSSSLGFLFAAVAASVGLSNIWRFSSEAAKNGGGIYVLCYIFCVLFVGMPVVLSELALGRSKQRGLYESYQNHGYWQWTAGFTAVTCFVVFCFYNIVAGWVIGYFWNLLNGELFENTSITNFKAFFNTIRTNWSGNLLWTLIMVLAAVFINQAGVSGGIEKCAKILMPLFMVMMVGLIIYGLCLEGSGKWAGITYYMTPNFSQFSWHGLASALSQSMISLGIGVGALVTYGAYVNKRDNLYKSSLVIVAGDTLVALLAGIFLFAFLGHANVDFSTDDNIKGTGLAFITLPLQFCEAGLIGQGVLGTFFLLLLFAAITSSISLLEVPTKYVESRFSTPRNKVIWILAVASYAVSMLCIAADTKTTYLPNIMHGFHDGLQKIAINIFVPLSGFLFSLFIAFKWKIKQVFQEADTGKKTNKYLALYMEIAVKYICPSLMGFCFCYSVFNAVT